MGQQVYELMVTEVLRAGAGDFLPVIERYGFKPDWVCPPSKKRRAPNDSHSSRAEAPRKLAPPTTSQSIAEAPPGNAHPVQSPIPTSQGSAETSPGDEEGPPDLALRTTSASNAEALPDLTPLAPAQGLTSDLVPRTTSPSNEEALPNVAPLASAQGNPQRPPNQGPRTTSPSNAEALPEPAPLAPAQVLTSEQQARIMENRARALAKRRARIKAKKKAKAQARRIASSLDETDDLDIGGEEDMTVDEEPAQSRGPMSERERAERDANARPQCVICQDFLGTDTTVIDCGHVFHAECIANYAKIKNTTLERACPFKCRAREVLTVDENNEAEQQRASLPDGLLLQAQQAEQAAEAAFT